MGRPPHHELCFIFIATTPGTIKTWYFLKNDTDGFLDVMFHCAIGRSLGIGFWSVTDQHGTYSSFVRFTVAYDSSTFFESYSESLDICEKMCSIHRTCHILLPIYDDMYLPMDSYIFKMVDSI